MKIADLTILAMLETSNGATLKIPVYVEATARGWRSRATLAKWGPVRKTISEAVLDEAAVYAAATTDDVPKTPELHDVH